MVYYKAEHPTCLYRLTGIRYCRWCNANVWVSGPTRHGCCRWVYDVV